MRVNEQGRSMIEMLGVLAIVGVLSVGGIAGYSKAMAKFKTNKVIDQINTISTNVRTLYSSQRNYGGLNNGTAIRMALIPSEMYAASNKSASGASVEITNAFGGNLYIHSVVQGTGTDNAYVIAVDALPKTACVSIATTDWGGDFGSGLVAMQIKTMSNTEKASGLTDLNADINTTGTKAEAGNVIAIPGSDTTTPLSIANAEKACGDLNGVVWKFQ